MDVTPPAWEGEPPVVEPVDEVLYTIGDVAISRYWIITPNQSVPIQGTRWVCHDRTSIQQVMPGYAVILCVVFIIFCFLGLLALAIREDRMTGNVEVTITSDDGFYHVTTVPVSSPGKIQNVQQAVSYAQWLASQ